MCINNDVSTGEMLRFAKAPDQLTNGMLPHDDKNDNEHSLFWTFCSNRHDDLCLTRDTINLLYMEYHQEPNFPVNIAYHQQNCHRLI